MSIRTKRNSRRFIAAAAAVAVAASSFIATSSPVSATSTVADTRVAGADRYATSVAIANALATTVVNTGNFVIASGDNYPDALAASALAGALGARVVLVPADGTLSPGAIALLTNATNVRIIGGTAAISQALELNLLKATGPALVAPGTFVRISGATRYETAAAVASAIQAAGISVATVGLKRTAIVVSGENFADAVLAAPVAYRGPSSQVTGVHPVLLTEPGALNASAQQRLISLGVQQVVIIGGETAVSSAVEASIKALGLDVVRVGGADRYATATALAGVLTTSEAAGGFGWPKTSVGLANLTAVSGGADALASAPWFGLTRSPLLGSAGANLPAATSAYLDANKATIATILVAGGIAAVPASVVTDAKTAAGSLARPTATIAALEGASSATVTFSEAVTLASAGNAANYVAITAAGTLNAVSSVAYNATTRVATLTFAAPLAVGTTIRVIASTIVGADTRSVAQTDFVVVADTAAPVATLTAVVGSAAFNASNNTVLVQFDKPVQAVGALTTALTVGGVGVTTAEPTRLLAGTVTTGTVFDAASFTTPLVAGQVVGLKAQQVRILGALGATTAQNAPASTTVVADLVRPAVTGVPTYIQTHTSATGSLDGKLALTAGKALSLGIAGNDVIVEVVSASAGTLIGTVTVDNATPAKITFNTDMNGASASNSALTIAAAINANVSASALVTASVIGAGGTVSIVSSSLAGGTTVIVVTMSFSKGIGATSGIDYSSGRVGAAALALSAGTLSAPFSPGDTTIAFTGSLANRDQLAQVTGSTVNYTSSAIRDLATNEIAAATSLAIVPG